MAMAVARAARSSRAVMTITFVRASRFNRNIEQVILLPVLP
jgi:hypothetical protein